MSCPRILRLRRLAGAALLGLPLAFAQPTARANTAPPATPPLPPAVQAAFAAAAIPDEALAVVVEKLDEPRRGYRPLARNTTRPMNPASVMKLFTTSAALDLLGPASTWQTEFRVKELPKGGVLKGPLYLKGSGDPKLAMEQLWRLLRELRLKGVREIRGDLVVDRSLFALPPHDPGAFDGEAWRPYNVGADAALVNLNALRVLLLPDPAGKRVSAQLATPDAQLRVISRLQLVAGDCGAWRDRLLIKKSGNRLELSGRYAESCGEKYLNLSPLSAEAQLDGLFRALWRDLGGSWRGKVVDGAAPDDARLLATLESPPLSEVVRDTNKFSNNVMARQLFLALSANTPPASYEKSGDRLRAWLAGRGIAAPELSIENGAGLSRHDRVSAETLAALLRSVWKSPTMPELIASLPVFADDGTLKKRGNGSSTAKGRAHLKTGYIDGVRALAGYVLDRNGERWLLVAVLNHPLALGGKDGMDQLVEWVAQGANGVMAAR